MVVSARSDFIFRVPSIIKLFRFKSVSKVTVHSQGIKTSSPAYGTPTAQTVSLGSFLVANKLLLQVTVSLHNLLIPISLVHDNPIFK